jgi:hypothetical protein
MLNIFELLAQGTIVAWDASARTVILWNESLMLRKFVAKTEFVSKLNEVDAITLSERRRMTGRKAGTWDPIYGYQRITLKRAKKEAEKWLKG